MTVSSSVFADGYGNEEITLFCHGYRCDYFRTNLYLEARTLQMKIKMLFLSLCLALSAFAAAPQFFIQGSTSWERSRLTHIEQSLNFTKVPMTSTWEVIILPGDQFRENVKNLKVDTESAYTFLQLRQTYVNEDFLIYADDSRVRQMMAHEAGHLICECSSEEKANEIAYRLRFNKPD